MYNLYIKGVIDLKLVELLEGVELIDGSHEIADLDIKGVAYDSRKVKEGYLFVAIHGLELDGHDYIPEAVKKGASAVVVTKKGQYGLPTYVTENNRKSLAIISGNYFDHPSKELTLIGLTASNGKTSTSMMLMSILRKWGVKPGLIGTVMYEIGEELIPSKLTTPESLELQGIFRLMLDRGIDTAVMEVSSIAQEMYRVHGTEFDVVCMNNITREHIDQHGTFEKYFEEKKKTITQASEDSFVILNLEDEYAASLIDQTKGHVITFSDKNPEADIYAKDIDVSTGFGKYTLVLGHPFKTKTGQSESGEFRVELKVAGYHSVVNSISAIAMALSMGCPVETVISGLEEYRGIERRFQLIYDDEFMVVDDHFANAGNIDMTLQTLTMMDYNKCHILYAIRGNRGVTVNGENTDTIVKWFDKLNAANFIVTKSRDTTEKHDYVHQDEVEIFEEKMKEAGIEYEMLEELAPAIERTLDLVEEGDLILLAGCQGIDHGGKILIDSLLRRHPQKNKEELYQPLKGRVAGMDI